MAINRVSTFSQQQQNLLNLLRNESSLNNVLLQQSTGNKAPTYAGVSPKAGQLLNVDALQKQSQGFIDNINSASTRLNLTDTALKGIGDLATNFQQELQQLQSSPTPPNISDLARTSLTQLGSLLNSADGTQFLFSGSQQSAAPVTNVNVTRIPTKTLSLSGNLDKNGLAPVNGNVAPPDPSSFIDVSLTGNNAVLDSNGLEYDVTLRFVHQSNGPPNQWQTYLVGLKRTDDNSKVATSGGQPISATNPVRLGNPFDPGAAAPVFGTAAGNALKFDTTGLAGVPQVALPPGGGSLTVDLLPNAITNNATGSLFTQADNATSTTQVMLNDVNLNPNNPVGDTTSITLTGPNALFATGATAGSDEFDTTITLTKTQAADSLRGIPELWTATITSLTDHATGAAATVPPISAAAPYTIGTFQSGQIPLGNITIGANGAPTNDAAGVSFQMAAPTAPASYGSLNVALRAGTVTTNPGFGSQVNTFSVNPLPPPGTPQEIELSANFSSGQPVNVSVATPTAGSFSDLTFRDAQALVDSDGNAHNLTLRIVKTSTGPDMYQLYAIDLTATESGKASTNPPISTVAPVAIGAPFDPTAIPAGGTNLTFSPILADGATMSVTIPLTSTTFDVNGGNVLLNGAENSSTAVATTPNGALNLVGNLSSSAAVPNASPDGLGSLTITAGGAGFNVGDVITFAPQGGGTAATAKVTAASGGAITGIQIINPGSGYTAAPVFASVVPAGGGGATFTATFGPSITDISAPIGSIPNTATAFTAFAGGSGYSPGDIVSLAAPNGGIAATATVSTIGAGGSITGLTIIDGGSGYTSNSTLNIVGTNGAGTGGTATLGTIPVDANNTVDAHFFGAQALRDSQGNPFDATVRLQYGTIGAVTGWRAYVTQLTDPKTGLTPTGVSLPILMGSPPFDAFHPKDASLGPITIPANGPQTVSLTGLGTTLKLTLPFNSENFSSNTSASQLAVGGASTASLSSNIADTTYFQPGGSVFDTSQAQLQLRTATDALVKFGVRADNPAFEQIFRVLNFFKDQSVPATPAEVDNASRLINTAIAGINALRADVANTQAVLKNESTFHQQTITLAQQGHDQILTADSATTAMNLNAIANLLQESFATLGTIKSLSLVNFLK